MYKLQCLSSNEAIAKKISATLGLSEDKLIFAPLNYKLEKLKYITLIFLLNEEEKLTWTEYFSKLTSDKRNALLKFALPLNLANSEDKLSELEHGLSLSVNPDKNQSELIAYLIQQKISYCENLVQKRAAVTSKFLQQLIQKLEWKNQVVLTGSEMSAFLEMNKNIKEILELGESIALIKLWDDKQLVEDDWIYLNIEGENYQLKKNDLNERQIRKIILFLLFYDNHLLQKSQNLIFESIKSIYESIYQMAPFPIAIEVSGRDLIWQNHTFSNLDLLPRTVKQMNANEKIHTKYGFFFVYKHRFTVLENQYDLIYLGQQSEKFSNANEELGIMTSSLAHEMNNPLSAIKAAIEVINIISDTQENKETLDQMHTSVHRCLQLVNIFLGFTKASHQLSHGQQSLDKIPLRDCWDYALQLMRARLISASLRLNLDWCVHEHFKVGNSNILTMMLYWILSQVVNIFERKMLVSRTVSHDQKFMISEFQNKISIKMDIPVKEIVDLIQQSLLMKHLLDLEGVKFALNDQKEIILSH